MTGTRRLLSPGPFSVSWEEVVRSERFVADGLGLEMALCNDFADEGLEFGSGLRDLQGFEEHGLGFVEELRIFREESDEGLVGFEFVAELGVHLDAGVGGDGVAGFGAACAEALDGPAYFFAVHGGEVAGGWG